MWDYKEWLREMTQTALELRHWKLFKNREDRLQNSLRETTGRACGLTNATRGMAGV